MLPFSILHSLAAERGDGLRPEFLELLRQREEITGQNANVVELSNHRDGTMVQAGPNPVSRLGSAMPDKVFRFPEPGQSRDPQRQKSPSRRQI